MDAFILSLIPAAADPRIRDVVALVLAHKGATVLAFLLSSGLGAQILIRILNAIPMAWWYSGLRAVAAAAGAVGRRRLTGPLWRPLEVWFENFLGKSVDAIRDGLDADNAQETAPAPPAEGPKP